MVKYFLQALIFLIISNSYAKGIDLSRFNSELGQLNKVQDDLWHNGISKDLASKDQDISELMVEDSISTASSAVKKDEIPMIENSLDKIKKPPQPYQRLRNRSR